MKVVDLSKIMRKDSAIYYKRYFTAVAILEFPSQTSEEPIEFTIETSPLSEKTISVKFVKPIDYPLMPVLNAVREAIRVKEEDGGLPL
jgi:hypothetical protein